MRESRGGRSKRIAGAVVVTLVTAVGLAVGGVPTISPASAVVSPSPRDDASIAYDGATKTVVLFGGSLSDTLTWRWNGTKWKSFSTPSVPPPRAAASMAYDEASGTVVLFGGRTGSNVPGLGERGDTWTWNGIDKTWHQESPLLSPSARWGAGMAYDPVSRKVVMFGGNNFFGRENDTWAWDGTTKTWTQMASSANPPGRQRGAMAYDRVSRKLVLFGGIDASFDPLNDTWTWDGSTGSWTEQAPATRPGTRQSPGLAFHKATGKLVMFDGLSDETWTWSGSTGTWALESPLRAPPGRYGPAMAPHPPTGTVVLFGGDNNGDWGDTWIWNGTNWKQRAV